MSNDARDQDQDREYTAPSKRRYVAPELTQYGTLEAITKGVGDKGEDAEGASFS